MVQDEQKIEKSTQAAMQPEERQKNQSTLRMCRVTGDSDKGAQKRPSLIILGQRYYYPLQAEIRNQKLYGIRSFNQNINNTNIEGS
mmetsp:Transcript_126897/g.219697  ORF Transcript_126897/g.219697 Transcript_126897/m.219697 type:complete len:86 (+) Transcript_126897:424-681(+)